ncbi:MAG: tRNA 2-thiouridine(34) synthase MnmA [Candidatus Paceibacterota bacterium]|jgi:tRNA-specific 2-thiouridylase
MTKNKNKNKINKTVFVGVSGGVDSAVSLALLKQTGFNVVGVFIKVWQPPFLTCSWREERRDAMRVCAHLDVPFLMFDFEKEYKKEVADYMIREYREGRTPNPDVMCNKYVKFGAFLDKAVSMGADYVATGHYSIRKEISGKIQMLAGKDKNKDQSYFLWTLNQKQLSKILFPIGGYKKDQVRKLAKKFNLPNAEKKDSQGVCFVGKLDVKDFLKNYIKEKSGSVLNEKGNVIGKHGGVNFYTIGERHGFVINKKTEKDKPYYVIAKDFKKNTITVSQDLSKLKKTEKEKQFIKIEKTNWISGTLPSLNKNYQARIRYRQKLEDCVVNFMDRNKAIVKFENPQITATSGQSLVLYDKEICLGGGIII